MAKNSVELQPGSFRDPSGFIYFQNGKLLRQVNLSYKQDFEKLISSGLFEELVSEGLLVDHKDVTSKHKFAGRDGYKIIQPKTIGFISYPYEWSFSQLKDAALTTLEIHRRALKRGMVLKDASAYNIQFQDGKPIFIDTLSFEEYKEGEPWVAYRQFCQHFLAPLALMARTDIDLSKLMRIYIDGIPLPLASKLLPRRSKLSARLFAHLHLHARTQQKHAGAGKDSPANKAKLSRNAMEGLIASLAATVKALRWNPKGTEWGDYYTFTNYSDSSFKAKHKLIAGYIKQTKPKTVWDVGANNGLFSRIASNSGIPTIAFDIDPIAVEKNYRQTKDKAESTILPLVMDLTNPSPALGWAHEERESLISRAPADVVMALALVHHLSISNNVTLPKLADFFASLGKHLIIEFVPKGDSQVDILLATRKDIFPDYSEKGFEQAFAGKFKIISKDKVPGSKRTLYLLKRK